MNSPALPFYIFNTHTEAEAAVAELSSLGIDMKKLSLVGRGYHTEDQPVGFYTMGDRMKTWGGIGAFWGSIWGLLMAPAVFFLPGIGLIAMAGPLVAALVGALEGAVVLGGVSVLGAALSQIGMSKEHIIKYESAIKVDKYVLTVHGTPEDQEKVDALLKSIQALEVA
jgi:hypothetical protein